MKDLGALANDWWLTILRWLMALTAGCLIIFSVQSAFSFSWTKLLTLGLSICVSLLVGNYQAKIADTQITFSPKKIIAFWGIIWLGVTGGLILALSTSIAGNYHKNKDRNSWISSVSADVISIFLAAITFTISLTYFKGSFPVTAAGNLLIPNEIIAAAVVMSITHFFVHTALTFLFDHLENAEHTDGLFKIVFVPAVVEQAASLGATIVLFLTFNHFGIEFGLVILPAAVIANLAYKIHSRSLEQQTKQIGEASRMHLATVEALATAIDARDQVGVGHVRRTQIYCVGLGTVLGMTDSEINALRTGALLHDIGNLAVPDHILNKPGRLTPTELEKTKIHSTVGASILDTVGFPYPVVPTVKYHHESWDGTGYPDRLRGDAIPMTARILTVCDSYDTMRSARPYRAALTRDDACNYLRMGSGKQFDPMVVSLFLKNLKKFEAVVTTAGLDYEKEQNRNNNSEGASDQAGNPHYVEQIKRANREVFTLYSLARDFSSSLNLTETLSLFTKKVAEFVPYDTCLVYLLDESKDYATAIHVDGQNREILEGKRVKVGEGATGFVLKKCKPVENVDPALDFAFSRYEFSKEYMAMACLPLIADEKVIGAISLYSSELTHYQDEHLRLLETVSLIAADAISNSLQHTEAEISALTDPMTGLPNARSLQIEFEKELGRSTRNGNNFQVLVLDLDGFKAVNDTFGHKAGDAMLKELGNVIRHQLRDYDFLARYGGDEFVAIVPDTESADVLELCRRIENAVGNFVLPIGDDIFAKVGISIGSASYPNHGSTFDQIINAADKAMYRTKAFHKQRKSRLDAKLYMTLLPVAGPETEQIQRPAGELPEPQHRYESDEVVQPIPRPSNPPLEYDEEDALILELDESHLMASSAVN